MSVRKAGQKTKAISLRKQGYSYNEICHTLGVAKSTCSVWLRGIKLSEQAISRLVDRKISGQRNAALTLRQYREERDNYIQGKVRKSLTEMKLTSETEKLICAILYWGEGSKGESRLTFTNSDPVMVKTFLRLLRKNFKLREEKLSATLHLHEYHHTATQLKFWSGLTKIPQGRIGIYRKVNTGKRKKINYQGCISVRYHDVRIAREIEYLYTTFAMR
jgi:hypothetical protein